MADTTTRKCIYCKARVATRHQRKTILLLCNPCEDVIRAENLWKKLGLTKPKKYNTGFMPLDMAERAAKYKELIGKGKTFAEIANLWEVTPAQLTGAIHRLRRLGYALPYGRFLTKQAKQYTPSEPKKRGPRVGTTGNEHGGGKYGVSRCKEGPNGTRCWACLQVRRKSNNEARRRRKEQEELYK